jgi:hypothetical protein
LNRNALCALAAGCEVIGPSRFSCGDGWGAARMLDNLCETDIGQFPDVEDLARRVARTPEDVQRFIQTSIEFTREEGEQFQSPRETLERGYGDCDCQARLGSLMLRAIGYPTRNVYLAGTGNPKHVAVQAYDVPEAVRHAATWQTRFDEERWKWLETTMDADYGEQPVRAAVRIGALRPDVTSDFARIVWSRTFHPRR